MLRFISLCDMRLARKYFATQNRAETLLRPYTNTMADQDDYELFQQEMQRLGIKKHSSDRHLNRPPTKPHRAQTQANSPSTSQEPQFALTPRKFVDPESNLSFQRSGIQHTMFTKLKRGALRPDSRLDLHRLTSNEAMARLDRYLTQAQQQGWRCVLVVHGKGLSSRDSKPILKSLVNESLRDDPRVLAFHSAQANDGGRGAIYILIKRQR